MYIKYKNSYIQITKSIRNQIKIRVVIVKQHKQLKKGLKLMKLINNCLIKNNNSIKYLLI